MIFAVVSSRLHAGVPSDVAHDTGLECLRRPVPAMNGLASNGSLSTSSSKLRSRLISRSLSSGSAAYSQSHPHEDRVIKYAPLQTPGNGHDSRSSSSQEARCFQDGSDSPQITDDEDDEAGEDRSFPFHLHPGARRSSLSARPAGQLQGHKIRVASHATKSNGVASLHSSNYRAICPSSTGRGSTPTFSAAVTPAGTRVSENLSSDNFALSSPANDMSTPSFSLTQQLLQQNVLSLISSSNGTTEVIRSNATLKSGGVAGAPGSVSSAESGGMMKLDSSTLPPYVCDVCGKRYVHHRSLNDHKKSHTGATRCPVCNKSFSKVANMRAHFAAQHANGQTEGMSESCPPGAEADTPGDDGRNVPVFQQDSRVAVKQMV